MAKVTRKQEAAMIHELNILREFDKNQVKEHWSRIASDPI